MNECDWHLARVRFVSRRDLRWHNPLSQLSINFCCINMSAYHSYHTSWMEMGSRVSCCDQVILWIWHSYKWGDSSKDNTLANLDDSLEDLTKCKKIWDDKLPLTDCQIIWAVVMLSYGKSCTAPQLSINLKCPTLGNEQSHYFFPQCSVIEMNRFMKDWVAPLCLCDT